MVGALRCIVAPLGVLVFFNARFGPFRAAVLPVSRLPDFRDRKVRSLWKRNDGCAMHAIGRSYSMHGIGETRANSLLSRMEASSAAQRRLAQGTGQRGRPFAPLPHCGKPRLAKMEETIVPARQSGRPDIAESCPALTSQPHRKRSASCTSRRMHLLTLQVCRL